MQDRTHAQDKMEAYLLQVRHALFELISVDDRIVSVEAFDDVAIETDHNIIAEQIKSALSSNNPVANKAVSFWKTLYNWCNYIKNNSFPGKYKVLKYVVVASEKLSIGSIPKLFSDAKNENAANQALESARRYLFNDNNAAIVSNECKKYVEFCFDEINKNVMIDVIISMTIDIHDNSYDDELKNKFYKQNLPPEYKEEIFLSMLGWVQERVHQYTKNNEPAYLLSSDYREALQKETRGRNLNTILCAISTEPNSENVSNEVKQRDTYIRQLEIIHMDPTGIFRAASDFLRTKSEKIKWAEKCLVTDQSFTDYDDRLQRMWENTSRIFYSNTSLNDIEKGKNLYSECSNRVLNLHLQGCDVPSFFGSGCLHSLANEPSDQPNIGWHPNYIKLLNGDEGE